MSEGVYDIGRTAGEEEYSDPLHDTESHLYYELQHPTSVYDTAFTTATQPESVYETVRAAAYKVSYRSLLYVVHTRNILITRDGSLCFSTFFK